MRRRTSEGNSRRWKARLLTPMPSGRTIEEFDGVWEELFPEERVRVLGLLLEGVEYEASSSNARLRFRAPDKTIDASA